MRRLGIGLVIVACALAPGPVQALQEPFLVHRTARVHYDRAGVAAGRGDYRTAAAELDAAYAIEPHPELLFVRAEVRRRLGECRTATILYRDFIATTPSESAIEQASEGLARCEQTLAAAEPKPAVVTPAPVEPGEPVEPVRAPPPRAPWQRDPAGGVLLGFGVVALVASVGLGVGAGVTSEDARTTGSATRQLELVRATNILVGTGVAAAAVGVGLVIGAALRYRSVKRRAGLGAWFDGHGGGLALAGRF